MNETNNEKKENYWKKIHNDTIDSIIEQAFELGFSNYPKKRKNKLIKK